MNSLEHVIRKKRSENRRKRNLLRRVFLFVMLVFISIFLHEFYLFSQKKNIPIIMEQCKLVDAELILSEIEGYINDKNFYQISPNRLSKHILGTCNLLKNIIVRKYIFPTSQLRIYPVEKEIWGKVRSLSQSSYGKEYFLSNEGDLILPKYVVEQNLDQVLIPVSTALLEELTPEILMIAMKSLLGAQKKLMLDIQEVEILDGFEMNIKCADDLSIKAGIIDQELFERIGRLSKVLEVAYSKNLALQYIDLTLEKSVVFKEKADNNDKSKE